MHHEYTVVGVGAWRALRDVPDPPAYPEMSAWSNYRQCYAREWSWMKVRSGAGCRYMVMYRYSPLSEVWNADDDEEEVESAFDYPVVIGVGPVEEIVEGQEEEMEAEVEVEVEVGVEEDLEPFPEAEEYEAAMGTNFVDEDEDLEPLHIIEDVEIEPVLDPAPPTTPSGIEVPTKDGDTDVADVLDPSTIIFKVIGLVTSTEIPLPSSTIMAHNSFPDDEFASITDIEEIDIAYPADIPIPTSPIMVQDTIINEDVSPLTIALVSPTTTEIDEAQLSPPLLYSNDADSDTDSSSEISSLDLPIPTLAVTIPLNTLNSSSPKTLSVSTWLSPSPPLSPIYDVTQIGLSPASEFIKQKRRDSQEALEDGEKYSGDMNEIDGAGDEADEIDGMIEDVDGLNDVLFDYNVEKALIDKVEQEQDDMIGYVCGKAAIGWDHLSNMSWTTTAAAIGIGVVLGGAWRVARRC